MTKGVKTGTPNRRQEIEALLEAGEQSSANIATQLGVSLDYVCMIRKVWLGCQRDYSRDVAYLSRDWFEENDAKFKAHLADLVEQGLGW